MCSDVVGKIASPKYQISDIIHERHSKSSSRGPLGQTNSNILESTTIKSKIARTLLLYFFAKK